MARRFRDTGLESRAAQAKLAVRTKPYFRAVGAGVNVEYRKGKKGGRWVAKFYLGEKDYRLEAIADADDILDANGDTVLDFWQAQDRARQMQKALTGDKGEAIQKRLTVKGAMDDYLEWMQGNRKSAQDARYRAEALILPVFGGKDVARLTAKEIRTWLRKMAETPPRLRTKKGSEQRFREKDESPDSVRRRKASANRTLTVLKAALNRVWREGKVPSDAEWRRVEPYEGVGAARIRYLTVAEARRLVNGCEPAFCTPRAGRIADGRSIRRTCCVYGGGLQRGRWHRHNPRVQGGQGSAHCPYRRRRGFLRRHRCWSGWR